MTKIAKAVGSIVLGSIVAVIPAWSQGVGQQANPSNPAAINTNKTPLTPYEKEIHNQPKPSESATATPAVATTPRPNPASGVGEKKSVPAPAVNNSKVGSSKGAR